MSIFRSTFFRRLYIIKTYKQHAVGVVGVTVSYLTAPQNETDFRLRRLHRLNMFAGIAMIVASVFMFKQRMEWVPCLLIAALIQLYTSFVAKDRK